MTETVKRYHPCNLSPASDFESMALIDDGEWVRFEDYERLRIANEQLIEAYAKVVGVDEWNAAIDAVLSITSGYWHESTSDMFSMMETEIRKLKRPPSQST